MPREVLSSQSRKLVLNVLEYFQNKKETSRENIPAIKCASEALKVSERTISRIKKEGIDGIHRQLSSNRKAPKTRDITERQKCEVRKVVYDLIERKQYVTREKIREELISREIISISKSSLGVLLKQMGFKYKIYNGPRALHEESEVYKPGSYDFTTQNEKLVKIENTKFSNDIETMNKAVLPEWTIKEKVVDSKEDLEQKITRTDNLSPIQEKDSVKIKSTKSSSETEKNHEIVIDEWKIKEEVVIEEDLEQNTTRADDFSPTQKEESLKIRSTESSNEIEKIEEIFLHEWKIKEEVNIKEDLEQKTTSMSPNGFDQMRQKDYSAPDCCECNTQRSLNCNNPNCPMKTAESSTVEYDCSNSLKEYIIPKDAGILEWDQHIDERQCTINLKNNFLQHKNITEDNGFNSDPCIPQTHFLLHKDPEEVNIFKCDQCNFKTLERSTLKLHLLRHKNPEEVKIFKCDQCNYKTFRKSHLNRHFLRHKEPEFKCEQCDYKTRYKASLKIHFLRHKDPEEVYKFKCDHCNYKTLDENYLKQHLLRHKDPEILNKFKCDQCNFKALEQKSLELHLLRHINPEEVKKFKCDQCDYKTFRNSHLKRHLLRHKNPGEVKKFKCDQCDYKTFRNDYLKQHLLRHKDPEEVKKFKCDQCEYKTLEKGNLNKHLLRHRDPE